MDKNRGKKAVKKPRETGEEEKKLKKDETGRPASLSDEDEVTMSFVARKLKDSCSD